MTAAADAAADAAAVPAAADASSAIAPEQIAISTPSVAAAPKPQQDPEEAQRETTTRNQRRADRLKRDLNRALRASLGRRSSPDPTVVLKRNTKR